MTIDVFPAGSVVTSQDAMTVVANRTIDMAAGGFSFNVSSVPALAALDIHGIYDPMYFWETYDTVLPVLERLMNEQHQTILFTFNETESIFYLNRANARSVHSPADIEGLRLRDHGLWIGKSIESWGASPMTVVPADVAVALERGTVDGGYTGFAFVQSFRLFESAPHITFGNLGVSAWGPLTMNLEAYNELTQAQRDIIRQAANLAQEEGKRLLDGLQDQLIEDVLALGGTVYRMTDEETLVFIEATKPLIDEARSIAGPLGNELIDALLSAPSRFR